MDAHRHDRPIEGTQEIFNGSYFGKEDFPDSNELKKNKISKIVWITEGVGHLSPRLMTPESLKLAAFELELIVPEDHDPTSVLSDYHSNGLKVYQLKINPYDCPYSLRKSKYAQ